MSHDDVTHKTVIDYESPITDRHIDDSYNFEQLYLKKYQFIMCKVSNTNTQNNREGRELKGYFDSLNCQILSHILFLKRDVILKLFKIIFFKLPYC